MKEQQKILSVQAGSAGSSGHPTVKGGAREKFITEFLSKHLGNLVSIGQGEIIDSDSVPGEQRNQHDIIIYKSHYPKIEYSQGNYAFMAESVLATIEVKSTLSFKNLKSSMDVARKTKNLKRNIARGLSVGYVPSSILNFLFAYKCEAKISTAAEWISRACEELSIIYPKLPKSIEERIRVKGPALDGIYILNKGVLFYDNTPVTLTNDNGRNFYTDYPWLLVSDIENSLLWMFLHLQTAINHLDFESTNLLPYIKDIKPIHSNLFNPNA
ncbi:hypothetical protein DGG96_11160 [Legionella qingyii]|uniref:DUF6602 domain-containing protein n=2 Tax=Legionella qingyii TaxID=2184757 RepID=A0A317U352_9GAMM|nr:DUF6602 domain-containing protein [Legionella qingyii]PWY55655.1 hypothetical protein DGG96_11160 [Legionella qingyii]RUR21751.1 hypothetical protein ELY20_11010 [Legionella qingyii]RUR25321.1 hypothetical protein ELY16_10340 [Legionella qingyii]